MKVNRFGMSQKLFTAMVKQWAGVGLHQAAQIVFKSGRPDPEDIKKCLQDLDDIKTVLQKIFLEPTEDIKEFLKCIDEMQARVNQELAVQA